MGKFKLGSLAFPLAMIISLYVGLQWDHIPAIREYVHTALDPTLGVIFAWDNFIGFLVITAIFSFIIILCQKLFVNQSEMKALRQEQKEVQKGLQEYKDHPEKALEFQKKQLELIRRTFSLTGRSLLITALPLILLFRWFDELLKPLWGGWWILYYIIASIIFSSVFKKALKVV